MIIDTSKIAGQIKESLKTTKGKLLAGVGAVAVAALIAIPAIAHEGHGERGMDHRGGHEQMSRGEHKFGGRDRRGDDGADFTLAQVAGLKMTMPDAVMAAEKATNGRALNAQLDIAADGTALVDVHLMLADGTASHVFVNTIDGTVATSAQMQQSSERQAPPSDEAEQSDEG